MCRQTTDITSKTQEQTVSSSSPPPSPGRRRRTRETMITLKDEGTASRSTFVLFSLSVLLLSSSMSLTEIQSFSPARRGRTRQIHPPQKLHQQHQLIKTCTTKTSLTELYAGGSSGSSSNSPGFDGEGESGRLDDDDEEEDDEDDEFIDMTSLGDWRTFRRALADNSVDSVDTISDDGFIIGTDSVPAATRTTTKKENNNSKSSGSSASSSPQKSQQRQQRRPTSVSKDNEDVLRSQNKDLAEEYMTGVWAHETSTPEVGGLVVRMPLEVELYRNHRHSIMGRKLKRILDNMRDDAGSYTLPVSTWYARAKKLVEDEMIKIASTADGEGQIDATRLKEDASEMLSLYLDNQERWQEVCLVVEHAGSDDEETSKRDGSDGSSTTFVLNRPMAFQLTESLARLVLFGAFRGTSTAILNNDLDKKKDLKRFMMAFRNECAVYVGGPDEQGNPAEMIHGIPDLPGAVEISPGTKIYRGGIPAAIEGVLEGKYNPLEFRFFFGCHKYEESALDVSVHLGKFQPVACARSLALKQCISLPKPLWHEVLELCGGELADLSSLELLKRDDLQFEVVDEYDEDDDDDDVEAIEIEIEFDVDDDDDGYEDDEEEDDDDDGIYLQ